MLLLLSHLLLAAPRPDDPIEARMSWGLRQFLPSERSVPMVDGISVVLEGDTARLRSEVETLGFPLEAEGGGRLQVWCPRERLHELAGLPGLEWARLPWRVHPKEATVTEGYALTMQNDWHEEGVTGKGVKIAVLDVGFRGINDLPAEERPASMTLDESRGGLQSDVHGVAVTEIVNDFAPDASYFLTTFESDVEFCDAIETLVNDEKVDVINGSIGFDNVWHTDGTSPLTACADWAVDRGVQYLAAAGNEVGNYRVGALSYVGNDGVIAIAGETELWAYTAANNASVVFRWSDAMTTAENDIDLVLYNDDGTECARSEESQDGEKNSFPVEIAEDIGCSNPVRVVVFSKNQAANLDDLKGFLYSPFGLEETITTASETLTLPGDVVDGITVGAYDIETADVAYYSSQGPTNDGRIKPDLVTAGTVSTAIFGKAAFEGTSAATPHATGLAALWIDATGERRSPAALKEWIRSGAKDLGTAGEDNQSGMGLMQADEVPACGCASGGFSPGAFLLLGLIGIRRRK